MYPKIVDINFFLPKQITLRKNYKKSHFEKILDKTGIEKVYTSKFNQTALDLAIKSTKKLILKHKKKIDCIIYVTQSPEYNLPSGTCIIQNKLGLKKNIQGYDINQGCSGYIYGLNLANSLILSQQCSYILLICSDTYRKYILDKQNSCYPIFSDGASSTIISKSSHKKTFIDFEFGTDGSGYSDLIVKNSGSHSNGGKPEIFMDGKKVLMFTMSNIPHLVERILKKNCLNKNQIKYFIFHQASKVVLENLKKKLNLPHNKVYFDLKNVGNTVSSTIPINLKKLIKNNKLKKGDKILMAGFGVGYSMGATILNW